MPDLPPPVSSAAIALGSNLGNREQNLGRAIAELGTLGQVAAVSSFFDTAPVGLVDQPRFLNAAVLLNPKEPQPEPLMQALLAIERSMGRIREGVPAKGPRLIDLDLLWCDDQILEAPGLTLPHPALPDRTFVLAPLAEIAPQWVHPILGLSVSELLARLQAPDGRG